MIPEDLKKNKQPGRPANHSLLVTEAEFTWLYAQVSKRAVANKASSSQKVARALESLYDKLIMPAAATPPNEGFVIKLTRDELQVINLIVGNTVKGLRERIIPEYAKRAPTSPRMGEATLLLLMLVDLEAKGRRIYDQGSHRRGNARK